MEIPLSLTSPRPDRLIYGFPVWYRVVMGVIVAVVCGALFLGDTRPGVFGWVVLAILVLAGLYEDRWSFDARDGKAEHKAGLVFLGRTVSLGFDQIDRFRVVPLVRGTIPGTEDEKVANEAALKGGRADDGSLRRERHKKPYLSLEIECLDGARYLVDHMPARKAEQLRLMASRIGDLCGKPVVDA